MTAITFSPIKKPNNAIMFRKNNRQVSLEKTETPTRTTKNVTSPGQKITAALGLALLSMVGGIAAQLPAKTASAQVEVDCKQMERELAFSGVVYMSKGPIHFILNANDTLKEVYDCTRNTMIAKVSVDYTKNRVNIHSMDRGSIPSGYYDMNTGKFYKAVPRSVNKIGYQLIGSINDNGSVTDTKGKSFVLLPERFLSESGNNADRLNDFTHLKPLGYFALIDR